MNKIREILKGIDQEDSVEGGWWETSIGAEFGAKKLAEVEAYIDELIESFSPKTITINVPENLKASIIQAFHDGGYRPKSSGIVMCNTPKRGIEI